MSKDKDKEKLLQLAYVFSIIDIPQVETLEGKKIAENIAILQKKLTDYIKLKANEL